jgi:hypothetical protein
MLIVHARMLYSYWNCVELAVNMWVEHIAILCLTCIMYTFDVLFLLGDSLASQFYVSIFWNTLFHLYRRCKHSSCLHHLWRWNRPSVLKHLHIKLSCWGIIQNKEYNIHYTKVWNQDCLHLPCLSGRPVQWHEGVSRSFRTPCYDWEQQLPKSSFLPLGAVVHFPVIILSVLSQQVLIVCVKCELLLSNDWFEGRVHWVLRDA